MVRPKLSKLEHVHWAGAMARAGGSLSGEGGTYRAGGGCLHMTCD